MSAYLLADTVSPDALLSFGGAVLKLAGASEEALGIVFVDVGAELAQVQANLVELETRDAVWREEGRQYTNEVARKDNAFAAVVAKFGQLRGRVAFVGVHSESPEERRSVKALLVACPPASRLTEEAAAVTVSRFATNLRSDLRLVSLARIRPDEIDALDDARDRFILTFSQTRTESDQRDAAYRLRDLARSAAVRSLRRLVDALEIVLDDAGLATLAVLRSNHLPLIRTEPVGADDDVAE